MIRSPRTVVRLLLAMLLIAVCYLNYWEYSHQAKGKPDLFADIVFGTASAPQQYRVLVVRAAWFLHTHAHLKMQHGFALLDFVSAFIACFVLLHLLESSIAFHGTSEIGRQLAYVSFLFLCSYYLVWLDWYQRPETLPTACLVTLMLLILSQRAKTGASYVGITIVTLLLALAQALVRADVSVCVYAGIALATLLPFGKELPQPRRFLLPLSIMAILVALGVQWVMMHRIYPNATYGNTAVFQLFFNLSPLSLMTMALFCFPVAWTAWTAFRRRPVADAPFLALLIGAILFFPLWATVGRIQEVRIFLPFALVLVPLSVGYILPPKAQTS